MRDSPSKKLIVSRFLCISERDGLVALFHQLHPNPIYIKKCLWKQISDEVSNGVCFSSILNEMILQEIIISENSIDQKNIELARQKALSLLDRPTILYLMMSQSCNFYCGYCPIPKLFDKYGSRYLSFDDAICGIKLWEDHIKRIGEDDGFYYLIFYGGEPLLNRKVFEDILPNIKYEIDAGRLPLKTQIMLCTNGSLIEENLLTTLKNHNIMVAIGLDGPKVQHDSIRVGTNGEPTFDTIINKINILVKYCINVVVSLTITPENIDYLEEYTKFLKNVGVKKVGYNLMKGKILYEYLGSDNADDYYRKAAKLVLSGMDNLKEHDEIYEYQFEKKLLVLKNHMSFGIDCTCCGNQIVVQPDGQVSNCPFLRFDQGYVRQLPSSFLINKTDIVNKWRKRIPLFNDKLLNAYKNIFLDGGGCAWGTSEMYGDISTEDKGNTLFTQEVLNELVWGTLPQNIKKDLQEGRTDYWNYRGVGDL